MEVRNKILKENQEQDMKMKGLAQQKQQIEMDCGRKCSKFCEGWDVSC